MNKVILIGRFTRDPEIRYSTKADQCCIAEFTLAVDRKYSKDENNATDFINCVAFGKIAEFAEKWTHKGIKMVVSGRIQTGSYTNREGRKVYTTDVVVEEMEFAESKNNIRQDAPRDAEPNGFMNVPDALDDELPFA